jgi:hypothetical protein
VRRLALLLCLAAVAAGAGPPGAGAGTECDGLIVCIPVAGPWVAVPAGGAPTYYLLNCPGNGQVIGGLDADRKGLVELTFLGLLGGPVGPGVTTGRGAVFVGRAAGPLATFRPLLGCIPATGGGGRGRTVFEPTRRLAAVAPTPEPTIRRVKNTRLGQAATQRVSHTCLAGERLLSFSYALAFRSVKPPPTATLASVRAGIRSNGRRLVVTVRSSSARPPSARVELQVHAICSRGSR